MRPFLAAALLLPLLNACDDASEAAGPDDAIADAAPATAPATAPELQDVDAVVAAENRILEQTLAILRAIEDERDARGAREALRAIAKGLPEVRARREELAGAEATDARAFAREVFRSRRLRRDVIAELERLDGIEGARSAIEGDLEPILNFADGR